MFRNFLLLAVLGGFFGAFFSACGYKNDPFFSIIMESDSAIDEAMESKSEFERV